MESLARVYEELGAPSRSQLYNLSPVGVGTPAVESITSYVARLAELHGLTPRAIKQEMLPAVSLMMRTLDGPTPWSWEFACALEAATTRDDLRYLTLGYWAKALSYNGANPVLPTLMAYCPLCFEEMRERAETVYAPLLWSMVNCRFRRRAAPQDGWIRHLKTAQTGYRVRLKAAGLCGETGR